MYNYSVYPPEVYEIMRALATEYISETDLPKTIALIDQGEANEFFPAGKWLLHDLDTSRNSIGK